MFADVEKYIGAASEAAPILILVLPVKVLRQEPALRA